jgi:effector-binding domain-containing protein
MLNTLEPGLYTSTYDGYLRIISVITNHGHKMVKMAFKESDKKFTYIYQDVLNYLNKHNYKLKTKCLIP